MSDFNLFAPAGFEWDEGKSRANLIKHSISFDDASQIFYGPVVLKRSNRNGEERWIAIGEFNDRILTVIFARRNESIRIISARRPRPNEKRAYREASMGRSPQGKH
ncbi:BrnT family toxin [Bradyrhizobium sp. 186]|uniref:BrnT family toxin n=1 Tax=Bradyrhizobium sp. 186 TaxID=2782654 RepID=UPI0020018432|nr:BrnT family toxin [Bradyrhizobium sp. 186]UPK36747.1 BrnT family toxin [Bradyrhizobium sp. 186]